MARFTPLLVVLSVLHLQSSAAPTEPPAAKFQKISENPTLASLQALRPTATPTSIPEVTKVLKKIFSTAEVDPVSSLAELILNGFSPTDIGDVLATYSFGCNSGSNSNSEDPSSAVYPQKSPNDAPYSLSEEALREAISIPSTFTKGAVPPLIMVPGTGSKGCLTFGANFIKQFTGSSFADPVWLNIPDFLLDDAQVNAEYVAYAINYISSISGDQNVSVIAWSQGNLDSQWALKYWPSTREIVTDLIGISPDFHGTTQVKLLCSSFSPCPPSLLQQDYNSEFVATLRSDDGDSAYVPTTTIYSSFADIIVAPQSGRNASGRILDARGVGVSNTEIQQICGPLSFATHEGVLYNPLAYALAVDALTNPGPGRVSRVDVDTVCAELTSPGLSLTDVIATEGNLITATGSILTYIGKSTSEPSIKDYAATSDVRSSDRSSAKLPDDEDENEKDNKKETEKENKRENDRENERDSERDSEKENERK